jgi:hypothetical protein
LGLCHAGVGHRRYDRYEKYEMRSLLSITDLIFRLI